MSDGGKGSKPRPFSVSQEIYQNNFERIFGKKESFNKGDQRITKEGILQEYREGYWHDIDNKQ